MRFKALRLPSILSIWYNNLHFSEPLSINVLGLLITQCQHIYNVPFPIHRNIQVACKPCRSWTEMSFRNDCWATCPARCLASTGSTLNNYLVLERIFRTGRHHKKAKAANPPSSLRELTLSCCTFAFFQSLPALPIPVPPSFGSHVTYFSAAPVGLFAHQQAVRL